jgi:phenylacetate-CoA ligase
MNRRLESIYYKSPVFLQNALVSFYGLSLRNRRYGGDSRGYHKRLLKSQFLTKDGIDALTNAEFVRVAKHALETVPFYRQWSRESGVGAGDIKDLRDITRLPVITKSMVRDDPFHFCSSARPASRGLIKLHTSGTSGSPLTVYCDRESRRRHYAFFSRLRSWFGVEQDCRRATFLGRVIVRPEQDKPPYWRLDRWQNTLVFSSYHMSDSNLGAYYRKLYDFQADEIIGYPSSLFALAKYMKDRGLDPIRSKLVITTAETLPGHYRDIIEEQFDASLIDQYGCAEMTHFVSQCEHGTYHIHPEHGIIEILDAGGGTPLSGAPGEAVCTGFTNYTMPLIRYRIGDTLTSGPEGCHCGRHFPALSSIVGRTDDILMTPDGRPLGRLDPIFKGIEGLFETQIVQTEKNHLLFKVITSRDFQTESSQRLEKEIRKRVGTEMEIEIRIVDEIPRDKNGKFKAVISLVKHQGVE